MEVGHQKSDRQNFTVLCLVLSLLISPSLTQSSYLLSLTPYTCYLWFQLSIQLMPPHYVMVCFSMAEFSSWSMLL